MIYVWVLAGIIGIITITALILNFTEWFSFFHKELRHLNSEIERTSGKEREYWKKRKKRLLLSIIPFIKY